MTGLRLLVGRLLEHRGTLLIGGPRHWRQIIFGAPCGMAFEIRSCLGCTLPGLHQVTSNGNAHFLFQLTAVGVALSFELDDGWKRRVAGTGEFVSSRTQFIDTIEVGVVEDSPQCPIWASKSAGKAVERHA
jgi:hypothetical protein